MKAFLQFPLSDFAIFDITAFALCFFLSWQKKVEEEEKGPICIICPPAAKLPGRKVEKKGGRTDQRFREKEKEKNNSGKKTPFHLCS